MPIILLAAAPLLSAACGSESDSSTVEDKESPVRVGIFVDNAFGDGDFFDQAAAAQAPLEKDLGVAVITYEAQLEAQNFQPLLQDAATANDLVFVLGFEPIDQMFTVADQNPDTTFVFVDADLGAPSVVSVVFRTAEGCFMAGALAATVNEADGSDVAAFIGGVNAPVVENCETGYRQGVQHIDPSMEVTARYVGSFVDPGTGSEVARALAGEGAFATFAYAGLSGAGAFDAASAGEDIAPIGVVADKSDLAPGLVPGSLLMGVDSAIVLTTQAFIDGELEKGTTVSYGFAEGGWSMVYNDDLLTVDQIAALRAIEANIAAGQVVTG